MTEKTPEEARDDLWVPILKALDAGKAAPPQHLVKTLLAYSLDPPVDQVDALLGFIDAHLATLRGLPPGGSKKAKKKAFKAQDVFDATFRAAYRLGDLNADGSLDAQEVVHCCRGVLGVEVRPEDAARLIAAIGEGEDVTEAQFADYFASVFSTRPPPKLPAPLVDAASGEPWALPTAVIPTRLPDRTTKLSPGVRGAPLETRRLSLECLPIL